MASIPATLRQALSTAIGLALAVLIVASLPYTPTNERHPYYGREMLVGKVFIEAVKKRLQDPSSAEFKEVKIFLSEGGNASVCGLVNAITPSDTSPRFEPFLVNVDGVIFRSDVATDAAYQTIANRICRAASGSPTYPMSDPPPSH